MEFIGGTPYIHCGIILGLAAIAAGVTGLVARMKDWDMERVMTAYILTTIYYIDTELGRTCTLTDLQKSCCHLTWFNISMRKLDQVAETPTGHSSFLIE